MRKQTISPTRITTYLACPVKYRWTHVDPRGKWYMRAKSYYSFGISLHSALERLRSDPDAGIPTTDEIASSLEESWVTAGYASPEEAAEAMAEGRELLTAFVEKHVEARPGAATLFVEKELRKDMNDFVLVGRIDRVDEHDDGMLEIIDYKTGRMAVSTQDVADDIAMNCYQILLRNAMPGRRVVSTLVALKGGVSASYEPGREELEAIESDIVLIGREITGREFHEVTPILKPICRQCDFLELCLRHEEFEDAFNAASPD